MGLLVTKLSCKCYDEHFLLTEIYEICIVFPKVEIDFIFVADSLQIGPKLSPQEVNSIISVLLVLFWSIFTIIIHVQVPCFIQQVNICKYSYI